MSKLGKTVDYSSTYDPSLLDPINRTERRRDFKHPMFGIDIWSCFELSFLKPNGLPEFHVIRIINWADSENIFESKSLKLYLNSFNNSTFESLNHVLDVIQKDLSKLTSKNAVVMSVVYFEDDVNRFFIEDSFDGVIDQYNYSNSLLSVSESEKPVTEHLYSNLLRSNCEITNQPDWARIDVAYTSNSKKIDRNSLVKYIVSYRNHQEFHEPTCERIYQDLYEILEPKTLTVRCMYTRRGGIDINPIRTSYPVDLNLAVNMLRFLPKTLNQ